LIDTYTGDRTGITLGAHYVDVLHWLPSLRPYPERLPESRGYPDDWQKRVVRKGGQIKWEGRDVSLGAALWGQEVGLKPMAEGLWTVYFETLELGIFDEQLGRVERIER